MLLRASMVVVNRLTCWTMIEDATSGDEGARERFASMYLPVVRAYLAARWKGSPLAAELDDAVQRSIAAKTAHSGSWSWEQFG